MKITLKIIAISLSSKNLISKGTAVLSFVALLFPVHSTVENNEKASVNSRSTDFYSFGCFNDRNKSKSSFLKENHTFISLLKRRNTKNLKFIFYKRNSRSLYDIEFPYKNH